MAIPGPLASTAKGFRTWFGDRRRRGRRTDLSPEAPDRPREPVVRGANRWKTGPQWRDVVLAERLSVELKCESLEDRPSMASALLRPARLAQPACESLEDRPSMASTPSAASTSWAGCESLEDRPSMARGQGLWTTSRLSWRESLEDRPSK